MANPKRNPKKSLEPETNPPKKEQPQKVPKKRKVSISPAKRSDSLSPTSFPKQTQPPKKPRSAYILFSMEKRPEVLAENPDLKAKEVMRKLGKLWKELPESQKEEYKDKQSEEKAAYERLMKHYEETGETPNPKPAQKRKAEEDKPKPIKKKVARMKK